MRSRMRLSACAALCISSPLCGSAFAVPRDSSAVLKCDPKGADALRLGYYPVQVALSESKPARVVKEPAYRTAPKYGVIRLGNGPKSEYVIALDEPADADWKIYLDANRNGDLTDDGDGAWTKKDVN